MEILTVKNLSFTYPTATEKALDNVSFSVEKGDFIALCGATGSGKSTLLSLLKRELAPSGRMTGDILIAREGAKDGASVPLSALDGSESVRRIGFVCQDPEHQAVTDKVWHELAFGLECLGLPSESIRRRVAETACYFGIEKLFERRVCELSGGQKQLLNLASVMVMRPDILILDEPTAQLDPIAASDFISRLVALNRDLSLTVIISEHRLEELIPVSGKLLALRDGGRVAAFGNTRETVRMLSRDAELSEYMPAPARLFGMLYPDAESAECPLTVSEGRRMLEALPDLSAPTESEAPSKAKNEAAIELRDVFFRYSRDAEDVLRGTALTVRRGEIYCILGGNGAGKSTALTLICGLNPPVSGKIELFGKALKHYKPEELYGKTVARLPQDVRTLFLRNTVREELTDAGISVPKQTDGSAPVDAGIPYDFTPYLDRHPYDLSGGQMQLLALAKVIAKKPGILLLDEPTKGLDAATKRRFTNVLRKLRADGMTLVAVTHDTEFAAECADRCAMLFRGEIVSEDTPERFFADSSYYTTAVVRMSNGKFITVNEAYKKLREGDA